MACTMWKGMNKHTFGRVTRSILPILEHSVKSSVPVVSVKQQWQSSGLYFSISEFLISSVYVYVRSHCFVVNFYSGV